MVDDDPLFDMLRMIENDQCDNVITPEVTQQRCVILDGSAATTSAASVASNISQIESQPASAPPSRPASANQQPTPRPASANQQPASRPASANQQSAPRPASAIQPPVPRPASANQPQEPRPASANQQPAPPPASANQPASTSAVQVLHKTDHVTIAQCKECGIHAAASDFLGGGNFCSKRCLCLHNRRSAG